MLAGIGAEVFDGATVAIERSVRPLRSYDADPEVREQYDRGYEVFMTLRNSLRPVFAGLASLAHTAEEWLMNKKSGHVHSVLTSEERDLGEPSVPSGAHPFLAEVLHRIEELERTNQSALAEAAELVWAALRSECLVHVAGSGHSTLFALEAFYRAGGLAPVNPIWHPMLLPLHGAKLSTINERLTGLGPELVRLARVRNGDVVVVFSQSGVNPVPVEIAEAARGAGAGVVGILSLQHNLSVPSRHDQELRLA